jgi:hypothetical protein
MYFDFRQIFSFPKKQLNNTLFSYYTTVLQIVKKLWKRNDNFQNDYLLALEPTFYQSFV